MTPATTWGEQRNLSLVRPVKQETLIYILGRLSRGEKLPSEVLILLAEHPAMMWVKQNSAIH
jgi:hypothetical protein